MMLSIADVLSTAEVDDARAALHAARFFDGRASAGWAGQVVKVNKQAHEGDETVDALRDLIVERLQSNLLFQLAARPKRVLGPVFSRYQTSDAYGPHADEPVMDGARSDVSFTLFLSSPESYTGGELILMTAAGDDVIKLPAGSLFVYPATTLHQVAPVTDGERLVAVGWVRSYVRAAAQRELLFDLDRARRDIFERDGPSAAFNLVSKSFANLMRMWCED